MSSEAGSEPVLRSAVRQDRAAQRRQDRAAGFRELLDETMAAQSQETRKQAFYKLQRFVIEQALQLPQFVVSVMSPKVHNFVHGLLITPKFQEVWLDA